MENVVSRRLISLLQSPRFVSYNCDRVIRIMGHHCINDCNVVTDDYEAYATLVI